VGGCGRKFSAGVCEEKGKLAILSGPTAAFLFVEGLRVIIWYNDDDGWPWPTKQDTSLVA